MINIATIVARCTVPRADFFNEQSREYIEQLVKVINLSRVQELRVGRHVAVMVAQGLLLAYLRRVHCNTSLPGRS